MGLFSAPEQPSSSAANAPSLPSDKWFRLIVESAHDFAIFTSDLNGNINSWNIGAQNLLGYTREEMMGQYCGLIFTAEDRAQHAEQKEMSTALARGRAEDERYHVRQDGTRFFASGLLMPLRDEDGTLLGFVKILRDLSKQKAAEVELQRLHDALQQNQEALEARVQTRTAELATSNALRQALLGQLIVAQEQERAHLARELHDEMAQHLTAQTLYIDNLKQTLADSSPQALALLDKLRDITLHVGERVHQAAFTLRPVALDIGIQAALRDHMRAWSASNHIPVDFACVGLDKGHQELLSSEVEVTVYRIVQEVLTNIARHAKSVSQVSVVLQRSDGQLSLTIEDDGQGFDVEEVLGRPQEKRRLGLAGIHERAALVQGSFLVESEPGQGTTAYLRVPLPPVPQVLA